MKTVFPKSLLVCALIAGLIVVGKSVAEDSGQGKTDVDASKLEEATVDRVMIGDEQSEKDHKLDSKESQSGKVDLTPYTHWRHAPNGWFSYEVKVLPDQPVSLRVAYWGNEGGNRTFDIKVGDKVIATENIVQKSGKKEFVHVTYEIPSELTKDKTTVVVRFEAQSGNIAGGVFDVRVLKKK